MDRGVPLKYWVFRNIWSGIHIGLVVLGLALAVYLFLRDGVGVQLAEDVWSRLRDIQRTISSSVQFPWG